MVDLVPLSLVASSAVSIAITVQSRIIAVGSIRINLWKNAREAFVIGKHVERLPLMLWMLQVCNVLAPLFASCERAEHMLAGSLSSLSLCNGPVSEVRRSPLPHVTAGMSVDGSFRRFYFSSLKGDLGTGLPEVIPVIHFVVRRSSRERIQKAAWHHWYSGLARADVSQDSPCRYHLH